MMCALMLFSAPSVVHAAPFVVFEKEKESETSLISAKFEVNRKLGRAWLKIEISDSGSNGEDSIVEVIRRRVDGLSYDLANDNVVYTSADRTVVCAEGKDFLFQKYLKTREECPISISSENRTFDDGFHVLNQVVSRIFFDARS